MVRRSVLVVCAAVALQACGGGGGDGEPTALPFAEVANGLTSATTTGTVAVQDEAAWAALWTAHTAGQSPAPALPAIDFTRQAVAAVFLGEVGACNRPRIDAVLQTGTQSITVHWTHVPPQPNELCIAAIVRPVQMVRFDNPLRLPVAFAQSK